MAISKLLKAAAKRGLKPKSKTASQKTKAIRTKPAPKKPDTYESEMKAIRNMALTPANRQNRMAKVAVKYGKPIKLAGKVFGPKPKTRSKPKTKPSARSRRASNDILIRDSDPRSMVKRLTPTMLDLDIYVSKLEKGKELTRSEKIKFVKGALASNAGVSEIDGRLYLYNDQMAKIKNLSNEQLLKKFNRLSKNLDDY